METKKAKAEPMPSGFEPFCKWRQEEGRDVLELHLQGFKSEEIIVRLNNRGGVEIWGQRTNLINSFFHKEVKIPEDCNGHEIRSKFDSGILSITMPKKNHWLSSAGEKIKSTNFDNYIVCTVAIALLILFVVASYIIFHTTLPSTPEQGLQEIAGKFEKWSGEVAALNTRMDHFASIMKATMQAHNISLAPGSNSLAPAGRRLRSSGASRPSDGDNPTGMRVSLRMRMLKSDGY